MDDITPETLLKIAQGLGYTAEIRFDEYGPGVVYIMSKYFLDGRVVFQPKQNSAQLLDIVKHWKVSTWHSELFEAWHAYVPAIPLDMETDKSYELAILGAVAKAVEDE